VTGSYVRMLIAPYATGTVKSARFYQGEVGFLFQQDLRFRKFSIIVPDVWLRDSELEPCARPSDEDVARIEQRAREKDQR
jgi:hypothetical protein